MVVLIRTTNLIGRSYFVMYYASEYIDLIRAASDLVVAIRNFTNLKLFSPCGKNVRTSFEIFEAILPLFEGNMHYFSITSCSRVSRSLILIDFGYSQTEFNKMYEYTKFVFCSFAEVTTTV